ncbi:MFS transporter [Brevundimonas sp.]|uniref:MFS transporter n=1 Tax=Brevundimonas sp. TaxID=1871086 RepID=UPI002FC95658
MLRAEADYRAGLAHDIEDRQHERFGGVKVGSAFFGWLTAMGTAAILTALLAAAGAALGLGVAGTPDEAADEALQNAGTVGWIGAIALLVVLFVAYFCGGYVAGRMARFDGLRQGLAVWVWALVIAIVVALVSVVLGSQYDVLVDLNAFPRIPVSEGELTLAGIVTAVIVWLFVREPKKGGLDPAPANPAPAEAAAPRAGLWSTCRMFFANPVLRGMALACGATQFVTYALLNFATLFLMREKGMTLQEVALWYALLVGVGVSAGMFLSGRLIDRLSRRSKTAYALLPAIGLAIAAPFFAGFVWAPTWQLALLFLLPPMGLNYFYLSPAVTLVQEEVPPHQRVLSGALLLLVMNLIGLGLGPTYLGAASDWFSKTSPDNSLQMAFYTLIPFYGVAIVMFLGLANRIRRQSRQEANT